MELGQSYDLQNLELNDTYEFSGQKDCTIFGQYHTKAAGVTNKDEAAV